MSAQKPEVEISADPRYSDSEIEELAHEFESVFQVNTAKYERFSLEQYAPILVFAFGAIASGFFSALGKAVLESIRKRLASTISNRHEESEVEFHYSYKSKRVELKVRSADGNVIASAFDQIQNTLEIVENSQADSVFFEFDSVSDKWAVVSEQKSGEQKVAFRFENVVAATLDSVTVRGNSYQLKEEVLKEAAKDYAGLPLKHEHTGPALGRIEKAWYENGKLMVNLVVFEPTDDGQRARVDKLLDSLKKGKGIGFSMGFSFNSKKR